MNGGFPAGRGFSARGHSAGDEKVPGNQNKRQTGKSGGRAARRLVWGIPILLYVFLAAIMVTRVQCWTTGGKVRHLLDEARTSNMLVRYAKGYDGNTTDELVAMGRPAVPHLIEAVKHRDDHVRLRAVRVLGDMGPEAGEAVPALAEAYRQERSFCHEDIAYSLVRIGRPDLGVPLLAELLKGGHQQQRWQAAHYLGQIGFELNQIGRGAPDVVRALVAGLKDRDPSVRISAAASIGLMGRHAHAALPALDQALRENPESFLIKDAIQRIRTAPQHPDDGSGPSRRSS